VSQLDPGPDAELGEDLVQVVVDGARAEEQLRGDLAVGGAVARHAGDLRFPGSELVTAVHGLVARLAHGPAGGAQFVARAAPTEPRRSVPVPGTGFPGTERPAASG
jgi:hypothetical protein